MNNDTLSKEEIGKRVTALIDEIYDMPDKVYERWIKGRLSDLTCFAMTILAAMKTVYPEHSPVFTEDKLGIQASTIPLTIAYMLGRRDAAKRFSRVLQAMRRYIGTFDPDEQPSRSKIFAAIGQALEVYGWPEQKKPDLQHDDLIQDALAEFRSPLDEEGGDDDIQTILRDLR